MITFEKIAIEKLCNRVNNYFINKYNMLISSQRTNVIKGFTSKNGKKFDASLKINSDGKIDFIFPNAKKEKRK